MSEKRRGLGRGLGALIPSSASATLRVTEQHRPAPWISSFRKPGSGHLRPRSGPGPRDVRRLRRRSPLQTPAQSHESLPRPKATGLVRRAGNCEDRCRDEEGQTLRKAAGKATG